MQYTIEQIQQWIKEGQAISPHIALELIEENEQLKKENEILKHQIEDQRGFIVGG